ncbi:hypothetical protein V8C43DRAFT_255790 [Trichoderma afarasin]
MARVASARGTDIAQVLLNVPTEGYTLRLISPNHHQLTHQVNVLSINPSSSSTIIPARTMAGSSSHGFAASGAAASLNYASSHSAPS